MKLFLAGWLVTLAGIQSDYDGGWVVTAFGFAMVVAAVLQHPVLTRQLPAQRRSVVVQAQHGRRERIVRERWRESRERYWPFEG